jgi:hypothetical protein
LEVKVLLTEDFGETELGSDHGGIVCDGWDDAAVHDAGVEGYWEVLLETVFPVDAGLHDADFEASADDSEEDVFGGG